MMINSGSPPNVSILQTPGPFHDGFVGFTFEVTATTNASPDMILPLRVEAGYFSLFQSDEKWDRFQSTHILMDVHAVNIAPADLKLPELPGTAAVIDTRYQDQSGRPYRYFETNGTWVKRADPSTPSLLATKQSIPIGKSITVRTNRLSWLVLLILTAPVPFLVVAFLRRRRRIQQ